MEKKSFDRDDVISDAPRGFKIPKVVVKFPDQMELRYTDHLEKTLAYPGFKEAWSQLQKRFPGISMNRHFTTMKPDTIKELMAKAQDNNVRYTPSNLLNYFSIDCPPGIDPEELKAALQSQRIFETAYVDYGPEIPPFINDTDDPRSSNQGYLDAAPDGINARHAFARMDNAHGGGINFVDMEQGWNLG
ncbi:MAG TPA: hypothetical protein VFM90_13185, partial [Cyclobacteriaceae bacterium]|nr:hypothetical protein [Cyclobacteriaceae bacterium]